MTTNEIISELYEDLLRFGIHISGDFHKGSDLAQDVLVKMFENEHVFLNMNLPQAKAWLFRTMKNSHVDKLRRQNLAQKWTVDPVPVKDFQDGKVMELMLNHLTEVERRVIKYKYYYGYTSKEIAELMNMNASTLRNHVAKGLKKLRQAYQEDI